MRITPRVTEATEAARVMIRDGTLPPGATLSAATLREHTGVCTDYCRQALRLLVAEGTLAPGVPARVPPTCPGGR